MMIRPSKLPAALCLALCLLGAAASGQSESALRALDELRAPDANLDPHVWVSRPVVVFADSERDPRFLQQLQLLAEDMPKLSERDVVIITDTDPSSKSPLRRMLRPHGFMLVLIGKDGKVKLRKPFPWSAREISRAIDKMPLRLEEIKNR